ncbi:hypothetical protein DY000_02058453 [Brassica cretica]|uniref:factor independent urate hydroxylase n=1 Tax=Brassica cretica TaxID=69181 RepID=A0ABQ7AYY2_BRACR|nr:hypothetical protein DY000_02058453 [Brassica cretica]
MAAEGVRVEQRHGKARVRVGRVWRQGGDGSHHFVEWNVSISLLSHCLSSYHRDGNSDIVATDTMKNTLLAIIVYKLSSWTVDHRIIVMKTTCWILRL